MIQFSSFFEDKRNFGLKCLKHNFLQRFDISEVDEFQPLGALCFIFKNAEDAAAVMAFVVRYASR